MIHSEGHIIPYRLTTVEITYHMPDHPSVLQNFIWQDLDIEPEYPVLRRFLRFWQESIDARLHTVKVAAASLAGPREFCFADRLLQLH